LDFARDFHYTKVPGAAAQVAQIGTIYTVTRNTSFASFRGSNGLLQYANENRVVESQTMDSASWIKQQVTISANATVAPDGTLTADAMVEDGTTNFHDLNQSRMVAGRVMTASFFAKAAGRSRVRYQGGNGANFDAYFNLTTGAVYNVAAGCSASMENWGNGWWRCILTGLVNANGNVLILAADNSDAVSYPGSGAAALYIWGVQAQLGMNAGAYLVTTGSAKYDQTRPHFDLNKSRRRLKLEGLRDNLCLQSEDFTTTWTAGAVTVTDNAVSSPEGYANADKVAEDNANANHRVTQTFTKAASALGYTFSCWVKAAERSWCCIQLDDGVNGKRQYLNLATGALGTLQDVGGTPFTAASASVEDWGGGWYRLIITATSSTSVTLNAVVQVATGDLVASYAGTTGSGIYAWGAQLEQASFASSYIPTTASFERRNGDTLIRTLGSEYSQTAGTVRVVFDMIGTSPIGGSLVAFDDGTSGNCMRATDNTASLINWNVRVGAVDQAAISRNFPAIGARGKYAAAWATNDFAAYMDAAAGTPDAAGTLPTVTRSTIGLDPFGGNIYAHIESVDYWPERKLDGLLLTWTR
jgi:hypothetical protein